MKRMTIVWLAALTLGLAFMGPLSAHAAGVGEEYQLCTSLGSQDQAEALASEARETVPGLATRLVSREVGGRTVHEIWVSHPEMTPPEICRALGKASCAKMRKDCPGGRGGE